MEEIQVDGRYLYPLADGKLITVQVTRDCGIVRGPEGMWHKVMAWPIGFNNTSAIMIDAGKLRPEAEDAAGPTGVGGEGEDSE